MNLPDVINGVFEALGGFVVLLNVRAILRDKEVKGVRWSPVGFFSLWGFWNIFYYAHLNQWVSWAGGEQAGSE